ncbi:MAG: VCBS repeat-containing protein [Planctomycetota bacterium]
MDAGALSPGGVGCVLEIPLGIPVTNFIPYSGAPAIVRDDPSVLSLFTVEPGYYLASFSGINGITFAGIAVRLGAPVSPQVSGIVKVALVAQQGSSWLTAQGDFAQISGPQVGSFLTSSEPPIFAEAPSLPQFVFMSAGDIDHDGADEILGTTISGGLFSYATAHWSGTGWIISPIASSLPSTFVDCLPGDFDGDGNLDVALAGLVVFGDGQGGWSPGPALPVPSTAGLVRLAVADLDGDGISDIVFVAAFGTVEAYRGSHSRTFSAFSSGLPSGAALGFSGTPILADVTGDGHPDIVAPALVQGVGSLCVFSTSGTGLWSQVGFLQPGPQNPNGFAVGRLGAGAPLSIIVAESAVATMGIRVFDYVGSQQWNSATYPIASGYADGVSVEDVNGDGLGDILLHQLGPNSTDIGPRLRTFYTRPGPTFLEEPYSGLSVFTTLMSYANADFDGDGWPDLYGFEYYSGGFAWRNTSVGSYSFGSGCRAGALRPAIESIGTPQLGNQGFAILLSGASGNTWGLGWLGLDSHIAFGTTSLPASLDPFGAIGCSLLVDPLASRAIFLGPQGQALWPFPLPSSPVFHRQVVYAQAATLAPGANALGLLMSQALSIRID